MCQVSLRVCERTQQSTQQTPSAVIYRSADRSTREQEARTLSEQEARNNLLVLVYCVSSLVLCKVVL